MGAIVVSGVDLVDTLAAAMDILRQSRKIVTLQTFKFKSIKNLLRDKLNRLLPLNCHKLCSSRFCMPLANFWTSECIIVSDFETRDELIDAVVAGSFIPFWSGQIDCPKFRGKPYLDGGFINNKPRFELTKEEIDSGRVTVGLCPFPCDVEVCPKTDSYWFISRFVGLQYKITLECIMMGLHCLLPFKISTYKQYFIDGYRNMKEHLLNNDFIKCRKCYTTSSKAISLLNLESSEDIQEQTINCNARPCISCLKVLEKVDSLEAPDAFLKLMDD